jgi:hypothetical protein
MTDEMARMYDDVITSLLGSILPVRRFVRRPKPTDAWFDSE